MAWFTFSQGLIRSDGSGLATFNVQYTCVSMRLWREEVVDAEVEQATRYGIRCRVGPFHIFVSEKVMCPDFLRPPLFRLVSVAVHGAND
jgi:DNA-directed RNA polymerase subunit E'/Rpb7